MNFGEDLAENLSAETIIQRGRGQEIYRPLQKQAPKKILIVDDDYDSIRPLQRALSEFGCYIHIAVDGYQAIELLMDNHFDLAFLDWKMPGVDGGETIEHAERSISSDPEVSEFWLNKRLPVITYSSQESSDLEVPRASHFAFIDHWMKPMRYDELHWQVREALNFVSNPPH